MTEKKLPPVEKRIFGRVIEWGEETNNAANFSEGDMSFGAAISLKEAQDLDNEGVVLTEEKGYATSSWILDKASEISELSDAVRVKLGGKVFNGTPTRDRAFVCFDSLYIHTDEDQFDSNVLVELSNLTADEREVQNKWARFWWD